MAALDRTGRGPAPPPARRGRWCRSHRRSSRPRTPAGTRPATGSRCARRRAAACPTGCAGFGSEKWRLGGTSRCSRHSTALISPAMPEAASVWPMFVLIEPVQARPPGRAPLAEDLAERGELDGIAHPRAGAVGLDVADAARLHPRRLVRPAQHGACTVGLGATSSPLPCPSLLTALPRITARIGSRSASARASGLRSTSPTPFAADVALRPAHRRIGSGRPPRASRSASTRS